MVHSGLPRYLLPLLLLPLLLGGCLADDDTLIEYRLRCSDDSASVASCSDWRTVTRNYFQIDEQGQAVSWWAEGQTPRRYPNCEIHNLDHWSCKAEVDMPAIEFSRGRRIQDESDTLSRRGVKRVTWFEWWLTRLGNQLLG